MYLRTSRITYRQFQGTQCRVSYKYPQNYLRDYEIEAIESGSKSYQSGSIYYIDLISILEQMGDCMINVSQELERAFIRK